MKCLNCSGITKNFPTPQDERRRQCLKCKTWYTGPVLERIHYLEGKAYKWFQALKDKQKDLATVNKRVDELLRELSRAKKSRHDPFHIREIVPLAVLQALGPDDSKKWLNENGHSRYADKLGSQK